MTTAKRRTQMASDLGKLDRQAEGPATCGAEYSLHAAPHLSRHIPKLHHPFRASSPRPFYARAGLVRNRAPPFVVVAIGQKSPLPHAATVVYSSIAHHPNPKSKNMIFSPSSPHPQYFFQGRLLFVISSLRGDTHRITSSDTTHTKQM